MNFPALGVEQFGRELILTKDLDPIYVALHNLSLPPAVLNRWLLTYWVFYSAGVACYLAEDDEPARFWVRMVAAAANVEVCPAGGRWSRGAERRHMRGALAMRTVEKLIDQYAEDPAEMVQLLGAKAMEGATSLPCATVMNRVKKHLGFGDWIAFKAADMLERCAGVPIDFAAAEVFMFDDPKKAALKAWGTLMGPLVEPVPSDGDKILDVVAYLSAKFADLKAPPRDDRQIGLQEIETVLCKWKSHTNGKYPLGKDTREIRHEVMKWTKCSQLAERFLRALPS